MSEFTANPASIQKPQSVPTLFSRCSPLPQWDETIAENLLQIRFMRQWHRHDLLQALIVIQHHFGAVTIAAQQWLARQFNTNRADIRALLHFYHFLQEDADTPHRLYFANNIIEIHQGMNHLFTDLQLGCRPYAITAQTSCIGLGDQGPAALINGYPLTRLSSRRIQAIREHLRERIPLEQWPDDWFQVDDNIRTAGPMLQFQPQPAQWLDMLRRQTPDTIIDIVQQAGLRGLGGAGFSCAMKWRACANAEAPQRYVVCNADEGEPGTFKDRVLLNHNLDAMLAGMVMCGHAVGASKGILYLRGEYLFLIDSIHARLQDWRKNGWLGDLFDIDLHLGAGAYICGEETAMLESIEGRRGLPRVKPPFPVQQGLHGMPTVVNNVETFVAAAWILQHGADAYRELGTHKSPGTRLHSVSGDCDRPGIYELAMGTPVEELLRQCGARNPALVQLAGPSGRISSPSEWHQALAFEGISPGGSVMVFDNTRSHFDIVRNFTAFFQHESCGFCTPCRAGTQVLTRDLDSLVHNRRFDQLSRLANLIRTASHCPLGHTAPNAVLQWLQTAGAQND